jgi:hypothetical protein
MPSKGIDIYSSVTCLGPRKYIFLDHDEVNTEVETKHSETLPANPLNMIFKHMDVFLYIFGYFSSKIYYYCLLEKQQSI